jgi:hypothetical protein
MTPFEDFLTGQKLAGRTPLPTKPEHGSGGGLGRQTHEMAKNGLSIRMVSSFDPMARSPKANYSEPGPGSGDCGGLRGDGKRKID